MEPARPDNVAHRPTADLDVFFAALRAASQRLLLLDYDGTLAPFHTDPDRAEPYPGVREHLDDIMRDDASRVVIVTGRPARDLWPLLQLRRAPAVWGSHGWEHLDPDGDYRCGPLDFQPLRRLLEDETWIAELQNLGGRLERKPGSVAIHWRGLDLDQVASLRRTVIDRWNMDNLGEQLQWGDFDGGIELRLPGRDKGYAIESLLNEFPGAVAAYLGDDLTDEDAFKAIKDRGLGVLVRPQYRPTFAHAWLQPPEELLAFLARWRAAGRAARL